MEAAKAAFLIRFCCRGSHRGSLATHDAGQSGRFCSIAITSILLPVRRFSFQGKKALPRFGAADMDLGAFEMRGVKSVKR